MSEPRLRVVPDLEDLANALLGQFHQDWMEEAACKDKITNDWFKDEQADTDPPVFPETVYDALRICARCPVQAECVSYAYQLEDEELYEDEENPWTDRDLALRDRHGCYAVPGVIRERFAHEPDRVELCLRWLYNVATSPTRLWVKPDTGNSLGSTSEGETA